MTAENIKEMEKKYIVVDEKYNVDFISSDLRFIKFVAEDTDVIEPRKTFESPIFEISRDKMYFDFETDGDMVFETLSDGNTYAYGDAKKWIQQLLQFEYVLPDSYSRYYYISEINKIPYAKGVLDMDDRIRSKDSRDKRVLLKH